MGYDSGLGQERRREFRFAAAYILSIAALISVVAGLVDADWSAGRPVAEVVESVAAYLLVCLWFAGPFVLGFFTARAIFRRKQNVALALITFLAVALVSGALIGVALKLIPGVNWRIERIEHRLDLKDH